MSDSGITGAAQDNSSVSRPSRKQKAIAALRHKHSGEHTPNMLSMSEVQINVENDEHEPQLDDSANSVLSQESPRQRPSLVGSKSASPRPWRDPALEAAPPIHELNFDSEPETTLHKSLMQARGEPFDSSVDVPDAPSSSASTGSTSLVRPTPVRPGDVEPAAAAAPNSANPARKRRGAILTSQTKILSQQHLVVNTVKKERDRSPSSRQRSLSSLPHDGLESGTPIPSHDDFDPKVAPDLRNLAIEALSTRLSALERLKQLPREFDAEAAAEDSSESSRSNSSSSSSSISDSDSDSESSSGTTKKTSSRDIIRDSSMIDKQSDSQRKVGFEGNYEGAFDRPRKSSLSQHSFSSDRITSLRDSVSKEVFNRTRSTAETATSSSFEADWSPPSTRSGGRSFDRVSSSEWSQRHVRRRRELPTVVEGAGELLQVAEDQGDSSSGRDGLPEADVWVSDQPARLGKTLSEEKLASAKSSKWNTRFISVLRKPDTQASERLERLLALRQLHQDFVKDASRIGKVIISEIALPPGQRTVPPLEDGNAGLAGGEKFISDSIFFKFAIDHKGLYGSDEFAAKVANHELSGGNHFLSVILSGSAPDLIVPLMALIDWNGFRLVASALLPIHGDETICYGSSDGASVHTSSKRAHQLMRNVAARLNLKGHYVGSGRNRKFIYGPGDMEMHRVNNLFYAIDLARVFPPEAKMKTSLKLPLNPATPLSEHNFQMDNRARFREEIAEVLGKKVFCATTAVGEIYFDGSSTVVNERATMLIQSYPVLSLHEEKLDEHNGEETVTKRFLFGHSRSNSRGNESEMLKAAEEISFASSPGHEEIPFLFRSASVLSEKSSHSTSSSPMHPFGGSNGVTADRPHSRGATAERPQRSVGQRDRDVADDATATKLGEIVVCGEAILVRTTFTGFLHRLLRPELVASSNKPLSSDTFTGFTAADDPLRSEHRQEVTDATKYLLQQRIPRFARDLNRHKLSTVNHDDLITLMHEHGINVRYLGMIRAFVTVRFLRSFILTEMCCRVFKNLLRSHMRRFCRAGMPDLRPLIVDFFNLVLGKGVDNDALWITELKVLLQVKFPTGLDDSERRPSFDLRQDILLFPLFARLQKLCGMKFKTGAQKQLFEYPLFWEKSNPLQLSDLDVCVVQTKTMERRHALVHAVRDSVVADEEDSFKLLGQIDDVDITNAYTTLLERRIHRRTEAVFGPDSEELISSYFRLSKANNAVGQFTFGLEYAYRGLSAGETLFGAFSEQTVTGLVAVGDTLVKVGTDESRDQAIQFYKHALRNVERLHRVHPLTAKLAAKLHFLLAERQHYEMSHRSNMHYLEQAYENYSELHDKQGATFAIPMLSLLHKRNDFTEKIEVVTESDDGESAASISERFWPTELLQRLQANATQQDLLTQLKSKSAFDIIFGHDEQNPLRRLLSMPPSELLAMKVVQPNSFDRTLNQLAALSASVHGDDSESASSPLANAPVLQRSLGSIRPAVRARTLSREPVQEGRGRPVSPMGSLSVSLSNSQTRHAPSDDSISSSSLSLGMVESRLPVELRPCAAKWANRRCSFSTLLGELKLESNPAIFRADNKLIPAFPSEPVYIDSLRRIRERTREFNLVMTVGEHPDPSKWSVDSQYEAIATIVLEPSPSHLAADTAKVRKYAVQWVRENAGFKIGFSTLREIVGGARWEQYCHKIETGPGDPITLLGCAQHYGCRIFVISSREVERWVTEVPTNDEEESDQCILIANLCGGLWSALKLKV